MIFNKVLTIAACISLLTSCGGGSSDDTNTTNQTPSEFFTLDTSELIGVNFNSPISFDELIDTRLEDTLESGLRTKTHFFYDNDNNLSESFREDTDGNVIRQTFHSYTFDNEQVINLERERIIFDDDGFIVREIVTNVDWADGIPQSVNTISETPNLIVESNFVYETNALGQVVRTFEVINGENVLSSLSEFSTFDDDFISIGDEFINIAFDTSTNEVRRQSFYSYDDENNTVIVINDFFDNNNVLTFTTIDFIIHDPETNQTIVLILDLDEFNNDAINNITLFNYSYFETSSCGVYHDMERAAFNSLIPTCITNLTN